MSFAHAAGIDRWKVAQAAEGRYWEVARQDDVELFRILHEKAAAMRWASDRVRGLLDQDGPWLEIGIGPLGIGCVHLVNGPGRTLIGVDPLSPVRMAIEKLSPALQSIVTGCQAAQYQHIIGKGEHIDVPGDSTSFVVCYNVLDHCDDPQQVVREAARVLKRGAYFVLGCDVYSLAGWIKYQLRARFARVAGITLDSIADLAHPHQFLARDLEALIAGAGLDLVAINHRPAESLKRLWSHAHRVLIVARKQ